MVQKELRKISQWFWKGFLKWYDGGGENGITSKMIFEVEVFFSSQNINFPFIWRDSWGFSFSLFFICHLRGFDDIWGENHFFKNFFSNGFNILAVDAYTGMELCTPTWLNHDYGDGGVVDILAMDAYSRVELCAPIFLGVRLANHFQKKSKLQWTHPLTKLNTTRVAMWIIFGSGWNVYVVEKSS
jgi:hypothetical protein